MHWIISAAGLAILFLLAWGAHRPAPPSYRDATLDDALPGHLKALASETEGRGRTRIRMPRRLLKSLEAPVRFLNALPSQDLLPAARWLCDNGRFLQEEIASLIRQMEETQAVLAAIREQFRKAQAGPLPPGQNWDEVFRFQGCTIEYGIAAAEFERQWYSRLLKELEEEE